MAVSDTSREAEAVLLDGYRHMSPAEKLARVASLNRTLERLAEARIRKQYGNMAAGELRLRLAALRLDARVMRELFGWDPAVHGL